MRKGINLKERHRHSGKDCELYFVPRVEPSSISPTTFTNSDLYGDLLYFCNVRWLTRSKMLRRVHILRGKIATEFPNQEWVSNLASHLDNLNLQLQGKLQLIHKMCMYAHSKQNYDFEKFSWEMQIMLTLLHCKRTNL